METSKTQATQKPKLEVLKRSTSYKLIVSPELEKKIRYYLGRFPNIEYSGTLFYKVEGSFAEGNLVVQAIDFLLQDIGTGGYTEFEQSPDVIAYMVEHPELLEEGIYQGLMHSHHTLGAFFSGTDISTLVEEGSERTHFVSLIIDTRGKYVAAITRVVEELLTATGSTTFPTFGGTIETHPITYTFTRKRMEYFMLDVEGSTVAETFQELDDRIEEVKKQKAAKAPKYTPQTGYYGGYGYQAKQTPATPAKQTGQAGVTYQTSVGRANISTPAKQETPTPKYNMNDLFDDRFDDMRANQLPFNIDNTDSDLDLEESLAPDYTRYKADPTLIDALARQLLTGNVNYNSQAASLDSLAEVSRELFSKRFDDVKLFDAWADSYVEFLVYYSEDQTLSNELDDDQMAAVIAHDLMETLHELPKNEYIESFIESIERYIL